MSLHLDAMTSQNRATYSCRVTNNCAQVTSGGAVLEFQALESHLDEFLAPFLRQKSQVLRGFKALAQGVRKGLSRRELNQLESRMFAETWVHADHWEAADQFLNRKGEA